MLILALLFVTYNYTSLCAVPDIITIGTIAAGATTLFDLTETDNQNNRDNGLFFESTSYASGAYRQSKFSLSFGKNYFGQLCAAVIFGRLVDALLDSKPPAMSNTRYYAALFLTSSLGVLARRLTTTQFYNNIRSRAGAELMCASCTALIGAGIVIWGH